jgi:photosystem II stability/assembly factor-like uncharacterized protein
MRHSARLFTLGVILVLTLNGAWSLRPQGVRQASTVPTASGPIDPIILDTFHWRSIGPQRGGRSIAISGVRGRPKEGYFGATGGGLWKTTDGGQNWAPVTDGQVHSSSVGAVAVSETNPDEVFIGMGESCIRGDILPGDGVYKSIDAGKTWTHVGFSESDAIAKIRIHPTNPDIVFVASFGKYGAPSDERGLYKSTDGGKTWRRVLFRDNKTGAVDISIDRNHPNVIYAALWEAYRKEYQMSSGGPGSGLFKSTDGGETWNEITRNPGLPPGVFGKIGVSVSGADSNRVYAIIESANGGLFSSDDAGATWKLVNPNNNLRQRAFYYTHVFADPKNKDLVYVENVGTFKSTDGGKTMVNFAGGDSHDLWIDPDDTNHVLHASDSGGAVTYNALSQPATFTARTYPTGQFYHVITTKHVPYHVCGAQQDSSTICVPSDTNLAGGFGGRGGGFGGGAVAGGGRGGRGAAPATYSPGGSEPGYIAPDPKDPDVFFAGGNNGSFLTMVNRRTGENREVGPYPRMFSGEPSSALVERVQWTFPIIFSPADPNVLYTATQHVWKTTNGGQTWQRISGDLTRHDPETMGDSGGPITHDMNGPEVYATVFALGPGKTDVNVLWAGSDDGLINVTRDGGKTWTNVTPKEMPDFGRVSIIDASVFDAGTAYVAVKKPLLNDMSPYIFRTHNFGKTWTKIVNGIGAKDYVHAVREDPTRRGLLYAGTEHGFYISYDDGDTWRSLSLDLPDTQVSDVWVEANDIAISTHGRGFYILDHVEPLRQWGPAVASADAFLFRPEAAIRSAGNATITYLLRHPVQSLTIDILDGKGTVVRSIAGGAAPAGGRGGGAGVGGAAGGGGRGGRGGVTLAPMSAGLNTVTWNVRYPDAMSFPGMILWGGSVAGPAAPPGTYQVRMTVDGKTQTQPLVLKRHPLHSATDADLMEQFNLAIQIRDKVSEANNAVILIRSIKTQVGDRLSKSQDAKLKAAGDTLAKNLSAVEEDIYQVRNQASQDPLNFPIKINNRLATLLSVVNRGDGKPIGNAEPVFKDLIAELKVQTDKLQQVLTRDLAAFNTEAKRLNLDPVAEK